MEMVAGLTVDIQVVSKAVTVPGQKFIQGWLEMTLQAARKHAVGDYEMVVRVVDEDEGRTLNENYRKKQTATNVLAFPAPDAGSFGDPEGINAGVLGDLVICGPIVEREAREQQKPAEHHWGHMLVHGTLHLLGYDHQTDAEAREMETLETRILAQQGVSDPYEGDHH